MEDNENKVQEAEVEQTVKADEQQEGKRPQSKKEQKKEAKKISELEQKLQETETKLKEAEEKLKKEKDDDLRLRAEFETFRRRTSEDRLNLISSASADTIKGLLPVLDDCERAIAMLQDSADEAAKEGTNLIFNKLMAYLKTKGLERIEAKGQKFDTDYHEAVTLFPAPEESLKGMVIDVVQTGYMLGDKVIRFAKVVVGA